MSFLRNLEERFEQRMTDLYNNPVKDSGDLEPIIFYTPDDPNRPQGIGNTDRTVPIGRVITDQGRMAQFLTSGKGIKFLAKAQLLQTGNAISETRIINPLFINLNLTPNEHFKRHLFDQADITIGSATRSPASTPDIGLAGRLQRETAARSLQGITNRPNARGVLSLLGASQITQTLAGTLGIGGNVGTLGINERPELDVGGEFYSVRLREGYTPFASRELGLVADALVGAGTAASIIGLPNIFRGAGLGGGANSIPAQTDQMRYFITSENETVRYINDSSGLVRRPIIFTSVNTKLNASPRGSNLLTERNAGTQDAAESFSGGSQALRSTVPSKTDLVSGVSEERNDQQTILDKFSIPEDALERRYNEDDRMQFIRDALSEQATLINSFTDNVGSDRVPSRGVLGGITLEKLRQINAEKEANNDPFRDSVQAQNYFQGMPRREIGINDARTAPGYYHDTLNLLTRISGSTLPREIDGVPVPQDFVTLTIFDKVNGRLEPFRAMLAGISETITPEFNETRYIGRIERNIVYLGSKRSLSFTLFINAWSPAELERIWDKINFMTGLTFPSNVSGDGFLLPPIVELTIGDLYRNQPGYFSSLTHAIEDGTSWEIEPGAQVPKLVQMAITYEIIEKESMTAASSFYGFGTPVT